MLAVFVQIQSITDTQGISKPYAVSQRLDTRKQHKYIRNSHGQSGCFPTSIPSG